LIDYIYCKAADGVVVQSESLAKFYGQIYKIPKDKLFVNYNRFDFGGSPKPQSKVLNAKKISIGFVGNIERHKGLTDMIKLCSRFPRGFELILAGKTKGYENKKLFRSLMATGKCTWKGQIKREKILKFYEDIDCLLLLSYHEGSPRVVREFLEYNKPIFLYNNPGVDYVSGLQGFYIYNYGDWKKCLNGIITHKYHDTIKRRVPKRLTINNLKLILNEIQ
ncbi:glycosyltransferase family 4 protein, partial [Paracoccaceae bacterium]|nr:glycosyltransferase family 4 protein [Paracoccaceae bacterium]